MCSKVSTCAFLNKNYETQDELVYMGANCILSGLSFKYLSSLFKHLVDKESVGQMLLYSAAMIAARYQVLQQIDRFYINILWNDCPFDYQVKYAVELGFRGDLHKNDSSKNLMLAYKAYGKALDKISLLNTLNI